MQEGEVTRLLQEASAGEADANVRLFAFFYDDLRRLARSRLRQNEPVTLLDTVSLVHDTFMRMAQSKSLLFEDRGRFFGYASTVMRTVIVDAVRARHAERRGGNAEHVTLDTQVQSALAKGEDAGAQEVLLIHDALNELGSIDARLAKVVEMRYFGGLSEADIAGSLGVTERTVRRDWDKAKRYLYGALKAD